MLFMVVYIDINVSKSAILQIQRKNVLFFFNIILLIIFFVSTLLYNFFLLVVTFLKIIEFI